MNEVSQASLVIAMLQSAMPAAAPDAVPVGDGQAAFAALLAGLAPTAAQGEPLMVGTIATLAPPPVARPADPVPAISLPALAMDSPEGDAAGPDQPADTDQHSSEDDTDGAMALLALLALLTPTPTPTPTPAPAPTAGPGAAAAPPGQPPILPIAAPPPSSVVANDAVAPTAAARGAPSVPIATRPAPTDKPIAPAASAMAGVDAAQLAPPGVPIATPLSPIDAPIASVDAAPLEASSSPTETVRAPIVASSPVAPLDTADPSVPVLPARTIAPGIPVAGEEAATPAVMQPATQARIPAVVAQASKQAETFEPPAPSAVRDGPDAAAPARLPHARPEAADAPATAPALSSDTPAPTALDAPAPDAAPAADRRSPSTPIARIIEPERRKADTLPTPPASPPAATTPQLPADRARPSERAAPPPDRAQAPAPIPADHAPSLVRSDPVRAPDGLPDRRPARDGAPADIAPPMVTAAPTPAVATAVTQPLAQAAPADALVTHHLAVARDGQWLDGLARDIAATGAGDSTLRFTLSPDHLGPLTVQIAQGSDGASVRLTAETRAAHALLVDAQPRLVAEARAQGLVLRETNVDLAGGGSGGAGQQPRDGGAALSGQFGGDARRQSSTQSSPDLARVVPEATHARASDRADRRAELYA